MDRRDWIEGHPKRDRGQQVDHKVDHRHHGQQSDRRLKGRIWICQQLKFSPPTRCRRRHFVDAHFEIIVNLRSAIGGRIFSAAFAKQ